MPISYQQTDTTSGGIYNISIGAAAGTVSHSATATSAGTGLTLYCEFETTHGQVGTATWSGACTVRWNITTANSNVTWSQIEWRATCIGGADQIVTTTSGLAIGLGTTGVKTASVETTSNYTIICDTSSSATKIMLRGTSIATMTGTFNFLTNQIITFPRSDAAAPVVTAQGILAQTNAGI